MYDLINCHLYFNIALISIVQKDLKAIVSDDFLLCISMKIMNKNISIYANIWFIYEYLWLIHEYIMIKVVKQCDKPKVAFDLEY